MAPTSPSSENSPAGHYIDIHPASWEEETVGDSGGDTTGRSTLDSQFSLEDMFSKIMEETNRSRRGGDRRTGKSFGGFSQCGGEHWKKRSFSLFRTRSVMLARYKEEEILEAAMPETFGRLGSDGSTGQSVLNAGRYFAALKGPELDQIKVRRENDFMSYLCSMHNHGNEHAPYV